MPTPSNTNTAKAAARMPHPPNSAGDLTARRRADSFPLLFDGELAVAQGVIENLAGVLLIAVFGAGRSCCPTTEGCPEPFRHSDDRRSLGRVRHRMRRAITAAQEGRRPWSRIGGTNGDVLW